MLEITKVINVIAFSNFNTVAKSYCKFINKHKANKAIINGLETKNKYVFESLSCIYLCFMLETPPVVLSEITSSIIKELRVLSDSFIVLLIS